MSDWHEVLTRVINKERAWLMNRKDERYSHKSVSYSMSVGSKNYDVSGTTWDKDPFILLLERLREDLKNADEDELEDILESHLREIGVQAYMAKDSDVLYSIVRMIDKTSEKLDEDIIAEQLVEEVFDPNVVQVFYKERLLIDKIPVLRNVFQTESPVKSVEIYRENEKLGEYKGNILKLLNGKYRIEAEVGSEENTLSFGGHIQDDRKVFVE